MKYGCMKYLAVVSALVLAVVPVVGKAAIWARSGIAFEATCKGPRSASSPPVRSPNGTVRVALKCKKGAMTLTVTRAGRVSEIALPLVARDAWRPQELLWSPDERWFLVNGSENAYAGDEFVVIDLHGPSPKAREITRAAQRDMLQRFPPCKAADHDEAICLRLQREPDFNMSAIAWTPDSRAVIVMGEVPSDSIFGGIMGQVEGYEIDSSSGRIVKRLSAKQLKALWQSEMAFKMTIPGPPVYGP